MTHDRHGKIRRGGIAAVELTLCMPVVVFLLYGIWEVGRMVQVYQVLANATREGARQASTGEDSTATIKTNVQAYIQNADPGITNITGYDLTFTNVTNAARSDPTTAAQLDHFQVTVTIPFDNVRWVATFMSSITNVTTLRATVDGFCMRDVPITVNPGLPVE